MLVEEGICELEEVLVEEGIRELGDAEFEREWLGVFESEGYGVGVLETEGPDVFEADKGVGEEVKESEDEIELLCVSGGVEERGKRKGEGENENPPKFCS